MATTSAFAAPFVFVPQNAAGCFGAESSSSTRTVSMLEGAEAAGTARSNSESVAGPASTGSSTSSERVVTAPGGFEANCSLNASSSSNSRCSSRMRPSGRVGVPVAIGSVMVVMMTFLSVKKFLHPSPTARGIA